MVALDTSIIIDHLRSKTEMETALMRAVKKFGDLAISLITIQELFTGSSSKEKEPMQKMIDTIEPLKIIPYTLDIATRAGELTRDSKKVITFADASIAATALLYNAKLLTLNIKDFKHIPRLQLATVGEKK
jgi:predicted nucleic acid-binding protein